jgi:UDP-N-acetylglucosamine:LPS N-acetylglucosamine transferase
MMIFITKVYNSQQMKTIGIFTSGYGHESIAQAILEKIEQQAPLEYKIKKYSHKDPLDFTYNYIYRLSPGSFSLPFHASAKLIEKYKGAKKIADLWHMINLENKITAFVKKNKIDICISAYFGFNPILEKIQASENIPLINVVSDPHTAHPLILSEQARLQLIFDQEIKRKHQHQNMKVAGWFVQPKFELAYDRQKIRKKLKISDDLTFLITSGSEGANSILKILPSIINCEKETNFIIACGNNEFLYNNILGVKQSLEKLSSSKAKIIPLGFTKNLHLYMQAADMVIGKAGPNTLFESIACETAFFAITHIHGQEDGNLDIIKNYKIGLVEENAKKANQKIQSLIKKPQQIDKFTNGIKQLKKYNQKATSILLQELSSLKN